MKSYSIHLSRIDQADEFKQLALEAGGHLGNGNTTIQLSGEMGLGQIKKWHLDSGLYMRVWDVVFVKPVELVKEASPVFVANNGFSLLCILTPESVEIKTVNQHQQFNKVREKSFILVPDSVNATLQIHAQIPVQIIDFAISSFWLKQQPGFINVSQYFNEGLMDDNGAPVLIEPCSGKSSVATAKLFNAVASEAGNMLSPAAALIKDFLTCVLREETDKTSCYIDLYYEKVRDAEAILLSHLQKTLPRVDTIAQKVALSESTLKRYFKLIYGRSIYEYYLSKKMELARNLLLQKPLTVNEAAEIMGYEKVSNFIDIFKKYHGYSPGTIKRKQYDQV
jgi:AraC-like DNA-binding protein